MTSTEIGIRSAEASDGGFVTNLVDRLADASRLPWIRHEDTERFAAAGCRQAAAAIGADDSIVLVATGPSGERLGFLHAHLEASVFSGDQVGYISTVVVAPHAERRGVGRRLIEAAEAWARSQGCELITLEVFGANNNARAVYDRLGYREQTVKLAKELQVRP